MLKKLTIAVAAMFAVSAYAGEWHSGANNLCSDCHTMHFSMQHTWDGMAPVPTTPQAGGNWLGASGPNAFLLKDPANQLCLDCHNGQSFAPDVLGANANASPTQGRSAGAVNEDTLGAPYDAFKGHTLGSTMTPPGFDPTVIGAAATWYDPAGGLECISCHAQHGPTTSYRNLGPYALGAAATAARPTYVIGAANDTTRDVWITSLGTGTVGSRTAADFNPYYDSASVSFNRNDAVVGTTTTSNRIDTLCAGCHGQFHGAAGDMNIGASQIAIDGLIRHPTSGTTLGMAGTQGYGGHSSLTRFQANTTKVKVYSSTPSSTPGSGYTDATPGCVSCHKAHGNQNPFGLVFLNGAAASIDEQGGYRTGQTVSIKQGYRNLCGQCHGQGAGTTSD